MKRTSLFAGLALATIHALAQPMQPAVYSVALGTLAHGTSTNFILPVPNGPTATATIFGNNFAGLPAGSMTGFQLGAVNTTTDAWSLTCTIVRSSNGSDWDSNNPFCTISITNGAAGPTGNVWKSISTNRQNDIFEWYAVYGLTNSSAAGSLTNIKLSVVRAPGL
jgi:hypothetical protein